MTNLELNDVQTKALIRELGEIIRNHRYLSQPRIVVLREILVMLRPEPDRPVPLPPLRNWEPPSTRRSATVCEANCRIAAVIACPIE